jgi:hypothetical protein
MSIVFTKQPDHGQGERERLTGTRREPRVTDRISENISGALGLMWVVGYLAVGALEPTTHHALPTIAIVLSVVFYAALLATAVGLIVRRRWGIVASLGASGVFLAGTVACPTTGHHTMGVWWLGQMVISLALVAANVVALQLSSTHRDAPQLSEAAESTS